MRSDPYKAASKRVKAKKGFFTHLAVFVILNIFLFFLNMLTSPHYPWFLFPMLSWGVAVAIQYVVTFGIPGIGTFDEKWEAQEIEKELLRMKEYSENTEPETEEELELKEVKKVRKDWDDSDLV